LAYSVYSYVSSYVDTGIFGAYVAVQPHKAKEVTALIIEDMNKLKNDRVDEMELKDSKDYLIGNLLLASESVDNQMVRLAQNEINFGYHIPLQTLIDNIESVSDKDILTLAEALIHRDQLGLTALGPLKNMDAFEDMLKI
jgi:predicted Zn-dependent peptidase